MEVEENATLPAAICIEHNGLAWLLLNILSSKVKIIVIIQTSLCCHIETLQNIENLIKLLNMYCPNIL